MNSDRDGKAERKVHSRERKKRNRPETSGTQKKRKNCELLHYDG